MTALSNFERELDDVFDRKDRYESHRRAIPVLRAMEADRAILTGVLRRHVDKDDIFAQRKLGPVIACDLLIKRATILGADPTAKPAEEPKKKNKD